MISSRLILPVVLDTWFLRWKTAFSHSGKDGKVPCVKVWSRNTRKS